MRKRRESDRAKGEEENFIGSDLAPLTSTRLPRRFSYVFIRLENQDVIQQSESLELLQTSSYSLCETSYAVIETRGCMCFSCMILLKKSRIEVSWSLNFKLGSNVALLLKNGSLLLYIYIYIILKETRDFITLLHFMSLT